MDSSTFVNSFVFKEVRYSTFHQSCFTTPSRHNYIMYLRKGRAEITSGGETITLESGDILHIPRGSKYATKLYGDPDILFGSYAYLNYPGVFVKTHKLQKVRKTPEMDRLIALVSESAGVNCRSLGLFYLFLAEMNAVLGSEADNKKQDLLENAMHFIRRNPDCQIPDVARHCHVSESGLYSVFSEYAGITPAAFKRNVRLENAFHYLISTAIPIEEISAICGFSSSSYFRKQFYALYGKTPSQVRKSGTDGSTGF